VSAHFFKFKKKKKEKRMWLESIVLAGKILFGYIPSKNSFRFAQKPFFSQR